MWIQAPTQNERPVEVGVLNPQLLDNCLSKQSNYVFDNFYEVVFAFRMKLDLCSSFIHKTKSEKSIGHLDCRENYTEPTPKFH